MMNASISNEGFPHAAKTEDSGENVGDFFDKLVPGLTIHSCMWGAGLGHEPDSFLGGQGRKVDVVLGGVSEVTAVVSGNVL
jgi:hypothetical protein